VDEEQASVFQLEVEEQRLEEDEDEDEEEEDVKHIPDLQNNPFGTISALVCNLYTPSSVPWLCQLGRARPTALKNASRKENEKMSNCQYLKCNDIWFKKIIKNKIKLSLLIF
jgi:hypothetical protein